MEIQIGKFLENKTRKYLLPCIQNFGGDFLENFQKVFKLGCGIHDEAYVNSSDIVNRFIYIMFDKEFQTYNFNKTLDWFRYQDFYEADYVSGKINSRKHMVVFKVPLGFEKTYDYFLKGEYSKMYSEEQKNKFFFKERDNEALQVLNRNPRSSSKFIELVNKEFGSMLNSWDYNPIEYDLPPKFSEEVFNWTGNKTFTSFKTEKII